jgi:hypothetical protein
VGGGISINDSDATLTTSTLASNSARHGGGVHNDGGNSLTVNQCTFSENEAMTPNGKNGQGGGIYQSFDAGTVALHNSTLEGNQARDGGGVFSGASLTVNQCTFHGNLATARGSGGAIWSERDTLEVNQSTIAGNKADSEAGGIRAGGEFRTLTLTNSIVAGNEAPTYENIRGSFAGSNNLTAGDPDLEALNDYGGPTQTMPPRSGSPATDAGGATTLTNDQRGLPRLSGKAVDIEFGDQDC